MDKLRQHIVNHPINFGGDYMLSVIFSLLMSCPLLMLKVSGNMRSFPKPLTSDEEQFYLERYANGDLEARNVLIERNLRLVAHIIKKYYTQTSDQDDLISIGTIGLIKGISSYRADKGVRLATYASRCIENEILMHFRSTKKSAGDISLSDSLDTDKEGNSLSLIDIISTDEDMMDGISAEETIKQLHRYLKTVLSERELSILTMRYGLDGNPPKTQREVASLCSISRSYVSRIETKAIQKLKDCFEAEDE